MARDAREPHYEDYYSCLWQIVQDETCEGINPLVQDFVASFKAECADLLRGFPSHLAFETASGYAQNPFASLADRAATLIEWVVRHSLAEVGHPVGLELLSEAARDFDSVDIFTLNHDTLLERDFRTQGITFSDGFGGEDGDARYFNNIWEEGSVRMLKLHGSINWLRLRFRSRGATQYGRLVANRDQPRDAKAFPSGT